VAAVRVLLSPAAGAVGRGEVAVVVDVLRATSTLAFAFAAGAARVFPAATVDAARRLQQSLPNALLCGERDGRRIEGFDLGNSPAEYRSDVVGGCTLVFASTNGSQAMIAAANARRRVPGSFVTATATAKSVARERSVVVICAGKLGGFCIEDAAFAGWLVRALSPAGFEPKGAGARLALNLAPGDAAEVAAIVSGSAHGRYLSALGPEFRRDVEICSKLDVLDSVRDL
jgi:2-phosphosulfolactate phosphatase